MILEGAHKEFHLRSAVFTKFNFFMHIMFFLGGTSIGGPLKPENAGFCGLKLRN